VRIFRIIVTIQSALEDSTVREANHVVNASEEDGDDLFRSRVNRAFREFPKIAVKSYHDRCSARKDLVSIWELESIRPEFFLLRIDQVRKKRIYQHRGQFDSIPQVYHQTLQVDAKLWKMIHLVELEDTESRRTPHSIAKVVLVPVSSSNVVTRYLQLSTVAVKGGECETMSYRASY
jgi:hypothetical protein